MNLVIYAYFVAFDFLINVLYTISFASIWFFIISESDTSTPFRGNTFNTDKSGTGFFRPVQPDATMKQAIVTPRPLEDHHSSSLREAGSMGQGGSGSTFSMLSIAFFWLIKLYCIIVVFSYARTLVVRSHLAASSVSSSSGPLAKIQRWMLSNGYWKEEDDDYTQTSKRVVN